MRQKNPPSPGDQNIMLTLAYSGTGFKGWQRLPGTQRTVQETVEADLSELLGERINLIGAGRTDAGVHSLGQTANFHTKMPLELEWLLRNLDSRLPLDIACLSATRCVPSFHARYRAIRKTYSYIFREAASGASGFSEYSLVIDKPFDRGRALEAAKAFAGTWGFKAFTNAKSDELGFLRTVENVSLESDRGVVRLTFRGDGFMYNQVRLMASAVMLAGLGRIGVADVRRMLESGVRHALVGSLGAFGLCLDSVDYRREDFLSEPVRWGLPGLREPAPSGDRGDLPGGGALREGASSRVGTVLREGAERSLGTNFSRGWLKNLAGAGLSSTSTLSLNGI